eukprot:scaffold6791_cov202-Prasinococcus_capsulatus_cf.AAC.1
MESFLHPTSRLLETSILGGRPFFTSVPSGRVGDTTGSAFRSNDQFREAVSLQEQNDVDNMTRRL